MCNRARMSREPETIFGSAATLFDERPCDNRFDPRELRPRGRVYVIREQDGVRAWDVMARGVLGGQASARRSRRRSGRWCFEPPALRMRA